MVRTSSGPDTEADADTGTAERAGDLWDGLLTAVRHCCALVVTVLLSPRLWWRRRRPGTRTVIGTAAMILASSLVSLLLGLSTATASSPVGPHEATWSTTLDSTVTLDLGPLGTASLESPAGMLGVKVVLGEIPGDPTPDTANAASVGQSLSSDATSYLSLVSHPDLTIRQGLYALAGDALRRAGVVEAIFLCCVAAWRLAPTKPWRETVRAGASHRWATTVAACATVATATSLLVPAMRTATSPGSTLSVLEGTPLAQARFSGRIADVVTAYGPKARTFVETNKGFYAKADTNLRAAWKAAEQTEGLVDVTAVDGKVDTERLQSRVKASSAKTLVNAGPDPEPGTAPQPSESPTATATPSISVTGARSVPERGRKTAVLTTDLHCNLDVIAFSGILDQLSGADIHMDDGDLTMTGSDPERVCVDALTQAVPSSTKKVATIGNHDSDATAARLRSQGWTVTDGSVQRVGDHRADRLPPGHDQLREHAGRCRPHSSARHVRHAHEGGLRAAAPGRARPRRAGDDHDDQPPNRPARHRDHLGRGQGWHVPGVGHRGRLPPRHVLRLRRRAGGLARRHPPLRRLGDGGGLAVRSRYRPGTDDGHDGLDPQPDGVGHPGADTDRSPAEREARGWLCATGGGRAPGGERILGRVGHGDRMWHTLSS